VRFWYRLGPLGWLLWPLSLVFLIGVLVRRLLYGLRIFSSKHPGIPVIVVGNITVGGSGKTPLVIWIAEHLKARGWAPGIISRGYGARIEAPRAATVASDPAEVGDEPVLLARRSGCPVWVGPERTRVAAALRAAHPEVNVLILDDGLQHYAIRRDIEIAVVDARGLGNGLMLPAGPLRESRLRLKTVDAVVAHAAFRSKDFTMALAGEEVHQMTDARVRRSLGTFSGQKVHAAAGIGDPDRFFAHLARAGAKVIPHPFPDHHAFTPRELDFGDGLPVILTEKDAVKLRSAAQPEWWVLPVSARLDPGFGAWLVRKLDEFRRPKAA
jgi:tetraacyldisaccharide 4'-kinase